MFSATLHFKGLSGFLYVKTNDQFLFLCPVVNYFECLINSKKYKKQKRKLSSACQS